LFYLYYRGPCFEFLAFAFSSPSSPVLLIAVNSFARKDHHSAAKYSYVSDWVVKPNTYNLMKHTLTIPKLRSQFFDWLSLYPIIIDHNNRVGDGWEMGVRACMHPCGFFTTTCEIPPILGRSASTTRSLATAPPSMGSPPGSAGELHPVLVHVRIRHAGLPVCAYI